MILYDVTMTSSKCKTIKGIGEITIFGLNCKYENEFPSQLLGRLAPEEFSRMILKINQILKRNVPSQVSHMITRTVAQLLVATK